MGHAETVFFRGSQDRDESGLRRHAGGTHTSRTIMVRELGRVLELPSPPEDRAGYAHAIVEENLLGKETHATRRLTNTRLGELYLLNPEVRAFRFLRTLAYRDPAAVPLLALLLALGRDPLLRASAQVVLPLHDGDELSRAALQTAIKNGAEDRLKPETQQKVARNVASSWTQSGHLTGRTFKTRRLVEPQPAAVVMALWLATQAGLSDTEALKSGWTMALDCGYRRALDLAIAARRLRLLNVYVAENVVSLDFGPLERLSGGHQ